MNELQTMFTILYGLYFAVTLTLTGDLQPFDTPNMYKRDKCGGPKKLDTFLATLREWFGWAEFENATKRSQILPGSNNPKTSGCAWSCTHPG